MTACRIVFIILILALNQTAFSQQIESNIIQASQSRLYFDCGLESGIQPGAFFVIECGGQESLSGIIEYAGPGISYCRPMIEIDSVNSILNCSARITVASIDSSATINLATDLPLMVFDPEHETLFKRFNDSVQLSLVDSFTNIGKEIILHFPVNIRFSDGSRLDSETFTWWINDLHYRSRSYIVRYFFAALEPLDSGGIEIIDGFSLKLNLRRPLPNAAFFLSHPDFAVYNQLRKGTGALREIIQSIPGEQIIAFVPNQYWRGDRAAFGKITIKHFQESYRMKFEFENKLLNGYIGFGFEDDLAGQYESKTLFPSTAVLISGIGGEAFSESLFPTSIYYRFDPDRGHLFFPNGDVSGAPRWFERNDTLNASRYYPYDISKGRSLQSGIRNGISNININYGDPLLRETGRYLADIAARLGTAASLNRHQYGKGFDLYLTFFPSSDDIMPFALMAAVLEMNDQNSRLPGHKKLSNPGWNNLGRGTSLSERVNRNRFFSQAEETVFGKGAFFPLFRPYIYGINNNETEGIKFDFYGYPVLHDIVKYIKNTGGESSP